MILDHHYNIQLEMLKDERFNHLKEIKILHFTGKIKPNIELIRLGDYNLPTHFDYDYLKRLEVNPTVLHRVLDLIKKRFL